MYANELYKPSQMRRGSDPRLLWLLVRTFSHPTRARFQMGGAPTAQCACHWRYVWYLIVITYHVCFDFITSPLSVAVGMLSLLRGLFTIFKCVSFKLYSLNFDFKEFEIQRLSKFKDIKKIRVSKIILWISNNNFWISQNNLWILKNKTNHPISSNSHYQRLIILWNSKINIRISKNFDIQRISFEIESIVFEFQRSIFGFQRSIFEFQRLYLWISKIDLWISKNNAGFFFKWHL